MTARGVSRTAGLFVAAASRKPQRKEIACVVPDPMVSLAPGFTVELRELE